MAHFIFCFNRKRFVRDYSIYACVPLYLVTPLPLLNVRVIAGLQFPLSRDEQLQCVGLLGGTELEGYIREERADIAEELGPIARDSKYRSLKLYQASA